MISALQSSAWEQQIQQLQCDKAEVGKRLQEEISKNEKV